MNMKPEQLNRLFFLLGALRDEVITDTEFIELNRMLEQDPAAQEFYLDYIYLCTDLCNLQAAIKQPDRPGKPAASRDGVSAPPVTLEMLQVWGDYERNAEILHVPQIADAEPVRVDKRPVKMPPRQVPRRSMITLAVSVAAVLLLILFVHLNPRQAFEVATLSNAVDAQWSFYLPLQKGTRLSASGAEPIQLKKGVIEIASDKNVTVTIEAPAEFCFTGPDEIALSYGRLFASVPPSGSGFSVQTANSKVIDLGTNFGVYSDLRGDTELHVFMGKTVLIAGQKGQDKQTVEVGGGRACRVDSTHSKVVDIALNHNLFARRIDPDSGLIITGGKRIDLADIVGGGDGSGRGKINCGIQWDGSGLLSETDLWQYRPSVFPADYVRIPWNPLIDGLFIPHCTGQEPLLLTSKTASLNLDAFLADDTNSLVTLILLHETTDPDAAYWFHAKETADADPQKYPALVFPNAPATGPVRLTTADGRGGDAYVSNDTLRAPTVRLGQTPAMSCRYLEDERIRIVYLRFDLSRLAAADLTEAVLNLYLDFGNRFRNLHVYGLKDGADDFWDEAAINYNTAPGLDQSPYGRYRLQAEAFDFLGTFPVVDNRISTDPIRVTADGTARWTAPNTRCQSGSVISNADRYIDAAGFAQPLMLGSLACGTNTNPAITVHANGGITFDLQAIRNAYGPVALETFSAVCGIARPAETAADAAYPAPAASLYVLLDGQEAFAAIDMSPGDPPQKVDIDLTPQARYLTLAATQGTDNSIDGDRCLFVNPALTLR